MCQQAFFFYETHFKWTLTDYSAIYSDKTIKNTYIHDVRVKDRNCRTIVYHSHSLIMPLIVRRGENMGNDCGRGNKRLGAKAL